MFNIGRAVTFTVIIAAAVIVTQLPNELHKKKRAKCSSAYMKWDIKGNVK